MLTPISPDHQAKIPTAFKSLRRFIFARLSDKSPCDFYGRVCSAHDPAKWLTPENLISSPIYNNSAYGIGFVYAPGDGRFLVDLDNCFVAGILTPQANQVLDMFPGAYVETSISGRGLHIIGSCTPELGGTHATRFPGGEVYTQGRYVLLAGKQTRGDAGLDQSAGLRQLITTFGLDKPSEASTAVLPPVDGPRRDLGSTADQYSDNELIEITLRLGLYHDPAKAFGEAISARTLWDADPVMLAQRWPPVGFGQPFDWTGAAAALIFHLMFVTGGWHERTLALFRRSKLYRDEDDIRKLQVPLAEASAKLTSAYHVWKPEAIAMLFKDHPVATRTIASEDFSPRSAENIPPYDFIYGTHYQRGEVSLTVAPGGTGKTALVIAEILSMVTMRRLFKVLPKRPMNVIYFGEDQYANIEKRFVAAMQHYGITTSEFYGRLMVKSLRDERLIFGRSAREGFQVDQTNFNIIRNLIKQRNADVVIFDTLRKIHLGNENDNGDMSALFMEFNSLASQCNCAVEFLAHTRKPSTLGISNTIDDMRGSRAQIDDTRSSRLIVRMTEKEAEEYGISPADAFRYFRFGDAKTNNVLPPNKNEWIHLQSVRLANTDNVQVAVNFTPQEIIDEISDEQMERIINEMDLDHNREAKNTNKWAGHVIGIVMGIPTQKGVVGERERSRNMKRVDKIIEKMISDGIIEKVYERINDNPTGVYRRIIASKMSV